MKSTVRAFKSPLLLLAVLLAAAFIGPYLPQEVRQACFALSLTIKEILVFLLPAIIFALLFNSVVQLKQGAVRMILLLLPMICLSNGCTTWVAYLLGTQVVEQAQLAPMARTLVPSLAPLWHFQLPGWLPNQAAMAVAVLGGLAVNLCGVTQLDRLGARLAGLAHQFLNRIFLPILPVFIFGFMLKLQADGILGQLLKDYAMIFLAVFSVQVAYVALLYGVGTRFVPRAWGRALQTMLPAGISGFSTLSSAMSLPMTLAATEANTQDKELTDFVVPATVNFHLVGDCIAIPIYALAIMVSFGMPLPGLTQYAGFVLLFVIAKFGVAAVPGGGILVMWPILASQLHFTPEMLSLIQTLYVMFDCVITATNVMGNGAFALIFTRIYRKLFKPTSRLVSV